MFARQSLMFAWHTYFSGLLLDSIQCLHGTYIFLMFDQQYSMFACHTYFSGLLLDSIQCLHGTHIFLMFARQYLMFACHSYFSGVCSTQFMLSTCTYTEDSVCEIPDRQYDEEMLHIIQERNACAWGQCTGGPGMMQSSLPPTTRQGECGLLSIFAF